ncbi:MAG: hypothetical protein ACTSX9_02825 [Candidatus Njordarchaeales archaeon]
MLEQPLRRRLLLIVSILMIVSNIGLSTVSWRVIREASILAFGHTLLATSVSYLAQFAINLLLIAGIMLLLYATVKSFSKLFGEDIVGKSLVLATIGLIASFLLLLLISITDQSWMDYAKYISIQVVSYAGLMTYRALTFQP